MICRFMRDYALRYWIWFAAGMMFLYLTNWMAVQIPMQLQRALDILQLRGSLLSDTRHIALTIVAIGLGLIAVRALSRLLFFSPGRYIEADLREDLFRHLMRLQPDYYNRHNCGEILSKLTNDIASVRALAGFASLQAVNVVMGIGLSMYKMLGIHVALTLYAVLPILVVFAFMQGGMRRVFEWIRRSQEALAELSTHVLGSYNGIAVVRAFNAETAFEKQFKIRNDRYLRTQLKMGALRSFLFPILSLMGSLSLFVLLFYGGYLVATKTLSVGQFAAMVGLVAVMLPALVSFGWLINVVQRGVSALERLYAILDTAPNIPFVADRNPAPSQRTAVIDVRNLSFTYPFAENPVLKTISFTLHEGEVLGIFGRTGAGKSTLFAVLARLYSPMPGQIFLKGCESLSYSLDEYRRYMALVPQRPFLFSESIVKNIAFGSEELPNEDELRRALKSSELERDIAAFPEGIHTVVGPRGITLSGGQRQRVTLARALVNKAPILLLDDVLSAVDHLTEEALIDHLYDHKRTTIVISHRLSALRRADRILVLDKGEIIAQGTHEALLSHCALYKKVWERQSMESPHAA